MKKLKNDRRKKSTIEDLREEFIGESRTIMLNYIKGATGDKKVKFKGSGIQREQVWELLRDMLLQAGDRTKLNVHGGDIDKQVKKVLRKVSRGKMSPQVAKEYIGLLQAGVNLTAEEMNDENGLLAKLTINTTKRK